MVWVLSAWGNCTPFPPRVLRYASVTLYALCILLSEPEVKLELRISPRRSLGVFVLLLESFVPLSNLAMLLNDLLGLYVSHFALSYK